MVLHLELPRGGRPGRDDLYDSQLRAGRLTQSHQGGSHQRAQKNHDQIYENFQRALLDQAFIGLLFQDSVCSEKVLRGQQLA